MPPVAPPGDLASKAKIDHLVAGTEVWRVHRSGRNACAVNPTPQPTVPGGGRFDSLTGDYAYTYVGADQAAAIAETLCRDLATTGSRRLVPRVRIKGKTLSRLTVTTPQSVAALYGKYLSWIGQDTWLTKCDPTDYVLTRTWAAAIFTAEPGADGLVYRCRHDEDLFAWMLRTEPTNGDHPALAPTGEEIPLDSPGGVALVDAILAAYNATLST